MKDFVGSTILCLGSILVLVGPTTSFAQEQYRTELSAKYQRNDFEREGRTLYTTAGLEYFLAPVHTDNHPYAEAAFLERIGSVGFSGTDGDYNSDGATGDQRSYDLFVNYSTPDFPVVITASWYTGTDNYKYNGGYYGYLADSDYDYYSLSLGKYLSHGLLVNIAYSLNHAETTNTFWYTPLPAASMDISTFRSKQYSLATKYVRELENGSAFNLEGFLLQESFDASGQKEHNFIVAVAGDYYFTRRVSAGVGIMSQNTASQYSDGKSYSINVKGFITPRFSVQTRYERFLNDNDGRPSDRNYALTLAARF